MKKLLISIIDGQGGGIGRQLVELLSVRLAPYRGQLTLRALGTNSTATTRMLKAGADEGATGENAIVLGAEKSDIIAGVMAIVMPNSILGELTVKMAEAVSTSDALKVLIPMDKCGTLLAVPAEFPLGKYVERAAQIVEEQVRALLNDGLELMPTPD